MATYKTYTGVQKLQIYLESSKDTIGFSKSLKSSDGTFDGKYGPDTDEAFWSWLEKLPPGSDLSSLVPDVLSEADFAQVTQAMAEFNKQTPATSNGGSGDGIPDGSEIPEGLLPPPVQKAGLDPAVWIVIGVSAVVTAGLIYWLATRGKKQDRKSLPARERPMRPRRR